jgi:hypothetical protein
MCSYINCSLKPNNTSSNSTVLPFHQRGAHIYIGKWINFKHWTKSSSLIASQGIIVAYPLIQLLSRYTSVSIAMSFAQDHLLWLILWHVQRAEHNKWREREPLLFAAYSSSSYCPARSSKCLPLSSPATLSAGLTSPDGGAYSSALVTATTRSTAGRNQVRLRFRARLESCFLLLLLI